MIHLVLLLAFFNAASSNSVANSNADLTAKLLEKIVSEDRGENLIFSPASLMYGIAMLYEGMDDRSRRVVNNALNFPSDVNDFRRQFAAASNGGRSASKSTKNIIVVSKQAGIKSDYGTRIKNNFQAEPFQYDFQGDSNKAVNIVNNKVSRASNGGLKKFLDPSSVSALTEVLLVNVMHFKSDWQNSFESETTKEDFQRTFGGPIQVDMMYGDFTNLGYSSREANNGAAQIVAIPFEDENYHMVLVLPSQERGNRGLSEFVAKDLKNLMPTIMDSESLPKTEAAVELPKFNIKTKVDLSSTLRKINGLDHMLSEEANFSRMTTTPVKVDEINHMAVIDVNQNGVEASAATGISIVFKSAFTPDLFIQFNRPFLFFIVEKSTKMILFAGKVENPN